MIGEVILVFEGVPRMGNKVVVSFTFALSFCSSFLLFRWFEWCFLLSEDSHVVQCVYGKRGGEDVQWGTVLPVFRTRWCLCCHLFLSPILEMWVTSGWGVWYDGWC